MPLPLAGRGISLDTRSPVASPVFGSTLAADISTVAHRTATLLVPAATSAGADSFSGFALGTGLLGVAIGGYWLYRRRQ